jgi:hypothetical protein
LLSSGGRAPLEAPAAGVRPYTAPRPGDQAEIARGSRVARPLEATRTRPENEGSPPASRAPQEHPFRGRCGVRHQAPAPSPLRCPAPTHGTTAAPDAVAAVSGTGQRGEAEGEGLRLARRWAGPHSTTLGRSGSRSTTLGSPGHGSPGQQTERSSQPGRRPDADNARPLSPPGQGQQRHRASLNNDSR